MNQRSYILAISGLVSALIVFLLHLLGLLVPVDQAIHDQFVRVQPIGGKPDSRIVLVTIDEESLSHLGSLQNWPDTYYTKVLKHIHQDGAKVIGLHLMMAENSANEKETLIPSLQENAPVILPFYYDYEENLPLMPAPIFRENSILALSGDSPSRDGITRGIKTRLRLMGHTYWSFPVELVRHFYSPPLPAQIHGQQMLLGDRSYPLVQNERLLLNYQQGRHASISYYQILEGTFKTGFFKDKIVIIGPTAPGLDRSNYIPVAKHPLPTILIHAIQTDNLLNRRILAPMPIWIFGPLILLIGTAAGFYSKKLISHSLVKQGSYILASCLLLIGFAFASFSLLQWELDVAPLIVTFLLAYVASLAYTMAHANLLLGSQLLGMSSMYRMPEDYVQHQHDILGALNVFKHVSLADFVLHRKYEDRHLKWEICLPDQDLDWFETPLEASVLLDVSGRLQSLINIPETIRLPLSNPERWELILLMLFDQERLIGTLEFYFSGPQGQHFNHFLAQDLALQFQDRLVKQRQLLVPQNPLLLNPTHKIELLAELTSHIQREREFFETVLLSSHVGVMVCDRLGYVLFNNSRFLEIVRGTGILTFERSNIVLLMGDVFPGIQEKWEYFWENVIHNREQAETELHYDNKIYRFTLTPVLSRGDVTGMIGMLNDITELRLEAITDGLTLLNNREYFNNTIQEEVERAHRIKSYFFTILVIDIDHFKKFNDTYGHQTGDRVLRAVGHAIRETFRKTDVTARYGGEEFSVILPDTGPIGAAIISHRLAQNVEKLEVFDHQGIKLPAITISIGISMYHDSDRIPETIFERADQALYMSKEAGRNRIYFNDQESSTMTPVINGKIQTIESKL